MLNVKFIFKKYKSRLVIWGLSLVFSIWMSTLLSPLLTRFNQYLIEKLKSPISTVVFYFIFILSFNVPIYLILVFIFTVWGMYKVRRKFVLGGRDFKILRAEYESGSTFIDITDQLNDLVIDNKLNITLSNGIPGMDPVPGKVKIGRIKYQFNNKHNDKKYNEGDKIDLP